MGLSIDVLCNDGSPLGVTSLDVWGFGNRGIGVGGAELALITMCEEWTKAGHTVTLYNNPTKENASMFEQRGVDTFEPEAERDVVIIFRSPNEAALRAKGLKVWWSCDQFTVGDFKEFAPQVDRIVVISPFHAQYFRSTYGIAHSIVIDLPVRLDDYRQIADQIEKVDGRCIWTSVPDRGLNIMHACWPLIKREVPKASLVITSDYRLWGVPYAGNEQWRMQYLNHVDVKFLGAISRKRLIEEQAAAMLFPYTCTYKELFCIACAEAQVAGVYPVTSPTGALATTCMGKQVVGELTDPEWVNRFVREVCELLSEPEKCLEMGRDVQMRAVDRFSPANILAQWDKEVFS